MKVNVKPLFGPWDAGYVLDKHMLQSTFLGNDEHGHPRFENVRSEVGQCLYALKYRNEVEQAFALAQAVQAHVLPRFSDPPRMIIPMPASKVRARQPVHEVARALGTLTALPVFEHLLIKQGGGTPLKDLVGREQREQALATAFHIHDQVSNQGCWNALVFDDLYDTGATMAAACRALRTFPKVRNIYAAALTWS